ncbi:MAG: MerR family DNA-binding transcriptional regulator [Elusimicrobia bacterium]|jgi:DNA-binding transcriptional MerR regulator|nr:MerR family DNA-binding transcriptional regulator [Elusimicrobiota bacterium]
MHKKVCKIGELSRLCGLSKSTIRYYKKIELIRELYRTPGRVSLYELSGTVEKINKIKKLKEWMTLKKIGIILSKERYEKNINN